MTLVFSYGSNSTQQLRGRVKNPVLEARAAVLKDFVRVFCLESTNWGGGSVASLTPHLGGQVLGTVVELNDVELERLDVFEFQYRKEFIMVYVSGSATPEVGIAYIAGQCPRPNKGEGALFNTPSRPYTMQYIAPPSEQYLTAIAGMIREHHRMMATALLSSSSSSSSNSSSRSQKCARAEKEELPNDSSSYCGSGSGSTNIDVAMLQEDGRLVFSHTWVCPDIAEQALPRSLEALCVEMNLIMESPLVMPHSIPKLKAIFNGPGVSARDCAALKDIASNMSKGADSMDGKDVLHDAKRAEQLQLQLLELGVKDPVTILQTALGCVQH